MEGKMLETLLTEEEKRRNVEEAADLFDELVSKGENGAEARKQALRILNAVSPALEKEFDKELKGRRDAGRTKRIQEDQYGIPDEAKDMGIDPEKIR